MDVNMHKLQGYTSLTSAGLLKGILFVLAETHCKDMTPEDRQRFMQSLNDEMKEFTDAVIDDAKSQPEAK